MDDNELQDKLDARPVDDVARLAEKYQMDDKVIEIMGKAICDMRDASGICSLCHPDDGCHGRLFVGGSKAIATALTEAGYEITKRDDTMATVPREPTEARDQVWNQEFWDQVKNKEFWDNLNEI